MNCLPFLVSLSFPRTASHKTLGVCGGLSRRTRHGDLAQLAFPKQLATSFLAQSTQGHATDGASDWQLTHQRRRPYSQRDLISETAITKDGKI